MDSPKCIEIWKFSCMKYNYMSLYSKIRDTNISIWSIYLWIFGCRRYWIIHFNNIYFDFVNYITMTIAKNDFTTSLCHKQQHNTNLVNNNFCYLSWSLQAHFRMTVFDKCKLRKILTNYKWAFMLLYRVNVQLTLLCAMEIFVYMILILLIPSFS